MLNIPSLLLFSIFSTVRRVAYLMVSTASIIVTKTTASWVFVKSKLDVNRLTLSWNVGSERVSHMEKVHLIAMTLE